MKQKFLKFLRSLESGKISAKRRNTGYIMLAGDLIVLSLLAIGELLFTLSIDFWVYWTLVTLFPVAALIVSFSVRPWTVYPLLVSIIHTVYMLVESNASTKAYGTPEADARRAYSGYNEQLIDAMRATPEYISYQKVTDIGKQLWIVYLALAFATLGVWLIIRIVQKAKREAQTQNNEPTA